MGGGRDYQKVAYYRYRRDANGNPIYMDNGEVAVERAYKYVRKTEYKRKQNAMASLQENNRSSMASRMASIWPGLFTRGMISICLEAA